MNNAIVNVGVKNCADCMNENKLFEILKILQWRAGSNYLSALGYDGETNQILVDKESLMRAIQMANPGQQYRDIRLVSREEYLKRQDYWDSDGTSWSEEARKEKEQRRG